ncbi:MAG: ribose-phosphate diphosphokinase [Candidatus Doudnabacteria bacterium]|nr:ribose-phosphate diphosphokinase [Candidatus Doudnabacteria bacterium]
MNDRIIFATESGTVLAEKACHHLLCEQGKANLNRFPDGELLARIRENVRGADVFIIGSICPPQVERNLVDLLLFTDACRESSARRITLVIPYLGYNRQDRKDKPRVSVGARVVIKTLATSGCHRVLLFDVHSEPTISMFGLFGVLSDHLYASKIAIDYLKGLLTEPFVVASPDKGGGPRAGKYAKILGQSDYVLFTKDRSEPGKVDDDHVKIIGEVQDRDVLFVDDMVDTAGTIEADAKAAREAGAKRILVFATHGLFSGPALDRINQSPIEQVIVTDSVPQDPDRLAMCPKIRILSMDRFLAEAINRLHTEESLSPMIL